DLTGPTKALVLTQLHGRLAAPWTCLVVVLIAVPFGTGGSRRNALVGVASSLVICFTFFVLSRFSLAFGTSGHLPSWLAAWLPNLVFATLGSVLITRSR
ncbi:MAG TPA: LptF/LptG family permease, partial [Roseimicrobium sp.]|nr:LptF/LptG family permease [Roseimicrobium sp.]